MGVEIERKFLLRPGAWTPPAHGTRLRQGYLPTEGATVRVRRDDVRGWITVKGPPDGVSRAEFEYEIPLADAEALLDTLCRPPLIDKVRYRVPFGEHVWEVDVFAGENAGLVVAEIELGAADEPFARPDWLGEEVSDDARYTNANLARNPYSRWVP
jgi:adenylate cyclase